MINHPMSCLAQKTAIRFEKSGPAIYHSHHDMIRFWERAVKRAELPVRLTQGFNPRPRIIFPHALGVGIASMREEVEIELYSAMERKEIVRRLAAACGDTVRIHGAENLPPMKKGRMLTESSYRISGWSPGAGERLAEAVERILSMSEIMIERGAPGDKRRIDIRPFVKSLRTGENGGILLLELAHSPHGSARPDEVAKLAAAMADCDGQSLHIEKTSMLLAV